METEINPVSETLCLHLVSLDTGRWAKSISQGVPRVTVYRNTRSRIVSDTEEANNPGFDFYHGQENFLSP
jgi:hypothetical protein